MGSKTLVRLLIILAVIGAFAAILHFAGSGGGVSEISSSTKKKKVFSDFPINEVSSITVEGKDGKLTVKKGETTWEVVQRDGYPANGEPIIGMLRDIWDLNIVQPVTIGRTQYGRVNLIAPAEASNADEAATIVSFSNKEGTELASLWLGKVYEKSENRPNPMGGGMATSEAGRYIKKGDSNSVYLVGNTFTDVSIDPAGWIDKTFFNVNGIRSIEIIRGDSTIDWKLVRDDATSDFKFAKSAEGEDLDQTKVSSMKSAFSNPQIEDVFTGKELEENKADKTTFKVSTFDGFDYTIKVGEKNDLNELPMTFTVTAKFTEKRKEGEEESDDEKKRLDEEFQKNLDELKAKLEREKKLEGHVFKIRSYLVDSLIKERGELLVDETAGEGQPTGEIAPGVSLPGLPAGPGN